MSLYCEFVRGSLNIAVSGCLEFWCLRLWGVLSLQCRRQNIVDQV